MIESESSESESEGEQTNVVSELLSTFTNGNNSESESSDDDEEEEEEEDDDDDDDDDGEDEENENDHDIEVNEEDDDNELDGESGEDDDGDVELDEESESDLETIKEEKEETDDDSEDEDEKNVFGNHYERVLTDEAAEQISSFDKWTSFFCDWKNLGRLKVEEPKVEITNSRLKTLCDDERSPLPDVGTIPCRPDYKNFEIKNYSINNQLIKNISYANQENGQNESDFINGEQKELLSMLSSYCDLYYPNVTHKKWNVVRPMYCLHAINHVLKTRKKVMKHNTKINKAKKEKKFEESDLYRDQGYSRPKILILLPFRHTAYL